MDSSTTTHIDDLGPINRDWTIDVLLTRLSDDTALDDLALLPGLRILESAVTGADATRPLSLIAAVRSLALAVAAAPTLRRCTVDQILTAAVRPATCDTAPVVARTDTRLAPLVDAREPQVA